MGKFVVLLRGVNVGGKNLLPMQELKSYLQGEDFKNIQTYIQSGNIILESATDPEERVHNLIQSKFGFSVSVLAFSEEQFASIILNNPYNSEEGKCVHFYCCLHSPVLNQDKLEQLISATESFALIGSVFYLFAPEGIGRSKLAAKIESFLGVSATGRNMNTMNKLKTLLSDK